MTSDRDSGRADKLIRQLVGFRLDGADYAIEITSIREIILMKPITRLPRVSPSIEGLINLRGTVIPLVNLRKRFGLAGLPFDDETRTIVVSVHDKTIGFIVDEVTQVVRITSDHVQAMPVAMASVAEKFISGLARLEDRLIIILDIERLFARGEIDLEPASGAVAPASLPFNSTESGA